MVQHSHVHCLQKKASNPGTFCNLSYFLLVLDAVQPLQDAKHSHPQRDQCTDLLVCHIDKAAVLQCHSQAACAYLHPIIDSCQGSICVPPSCGQCDLPIGPDPQNIGFVKAQNNIIGGRISVHMFKSPATRSGNAGSSTLAQVQGMKISLMPWNATTMLLVAHKQAGKANQEESAATIILEHHSLV
jgi:hypothetical protein